MNQGTPKATILVVDDEQDICDITRMFLERHGFKVVLAYDAKSAYAAFEKAKPQVVLLDILLGKDSGIDVLRKFKEIDPEIKVIMVTALDDATTIRECKALGADDYVSKPFTASYLNDLVLQKIALLSRRE